MHFLPLLTKSVRVMDPEAREPASRFFDKTGDDLHGFLSDDAQDLATGDLQDFAGEGLAI